MLGFKSTTYAAIILCGVEMVQMMRNRQARYAHNPAPSLSNSSKYWPREKLSRQPFLISVSSLRQNPAKGIIDFLTRDGAVDSEEARKGGHHQR
jgi:hypothetical protein